MCHMSCVTSHLFFGVCFIVLIGGGSVITKVTLSSFLKIGLVGKNLSPKLVAKQTENTTYLNYLFSFNFKQFFIFFGLKSYTL